MTVATSARMTTARHVGSPGWAGFKATIVNQVKSFYREPAALAFTLGQPLILLLILNSFNFKVTLPNGETRPYLDRLLPGLIAFNGMTVGLNSVAFALARDKQRGVLRRLRATPIPTISFVGGVIVSRLIVAALVTLITWASGVYLFGAHLDGNDTFLLTLAVAGSGVFIAFGILMVALARSEDDIPPMFILILMPSLLYSGAFLDRAGLPNWLHWITGGLPLTFLTDAVQQIANLNGGFSDIQGDLLGLAIWGALATALAGWKFKMA
jgi:ABC-2 type transport system permease protein